MILKNIEIKARINDYEKVKKLVEELCPTPVQTEQQEDTFFNTPKGRLKLRESNHTSSLIYYDRKDSLEPSQSDIAISFTKDSDTLKSVLVKSNGIRGIVKKRRILYEFGQTRIHLDDVKGLGKFLELEVVLKPDQTLKDGETIAYELMDKFGIQKNDLIDVAYIDLIETTPQ
jgi:predicted adenylyl cyclase CyaB